jgi:hypothetical protein
MRVGQQHDPIHDSGLSIARRAKAAHLQQLVNKEFFPSEPSQQGYIHILGGADVTPAQHRHAANNAEFPITLPEEFLHFGRSPV